MIRSINDLIIREVQNPAEMDAVLSIRKTVFIDEQGVPETLERDGRDQDSRHFIAVYKGMIAGCARLRLEPGSARLERMAVLQKYRGRQIAERLLDHILKFCRIQQFNIIVLHSQYYLKGFYGRHGFEEVGQPFEEAGIKHIRMQLRRESDLDSPACQYLLK